MEPTAIQHLMSAIRQNTSGTKHIPKLPPKLIGKDKDVIQAVLMELYKDVVEDRGGRFREIAGTEVAENIAAAAEWMTGPKLKTTLLLQGTLGSGKSSLMNALCSLYRYGASGIYKCTALMVYDQFKAKLDKQPSYYDEFKKADYLFLDEEKNLCCGRPLRQQGYTEQAKFIYSKLSLRYPEKSAYFASLIENLKEEN